MNQKCVQVYISVSGDLYGALIMASLRLTCNSLCFSGSRRHEHRHRFVGPVNPACVFSGCNLTADGCVCSSQSCDDHFTYINRSQCQRAAGNAAHSHWTDLWNASDVDEGLQTRKQRTFAQPSLAFVKSYRC